MKAKGTRKESGRLQGALPGGVPSMVVSPGWTWGNILLFSYLCSKSENWAI